ETIFTPPAFPRPPACTCALTTHLGNFMNSAICNASSTLLATCPFETGKSYCPSNCLAWYSCRFIQYSHLLDLLHHLRLLLNFFDTFIGLTHHRLFVLFCVKNNSQMLIYLYVNCVFRIIFALNSTKNASVRQS